MEIFTYLFSAIVEDSQAATAARKGDLGLCSDLGPLYDPAERVLMLLGYRGHLLAIIAII